MAKSLGAFASRQDHHVDLAITFVLDCAAEIPSKIPAYAALVAILAAQNTDHHLDLAQRILDEADRRLRDFLSTGHHPLARAMLRFLASLAALGVTPAAPVRTCLLDVLQAARRCAESHREQPHTLWQPYSDSLVRIALLALPFGMPRLAQGTAEVAPDQLPEGEGDLLGPLFETTEAYLSLRPCGMDRRYAPCTVAIDGSDPTEDSGMYTSTMETVQAVAECHATNGWGALTSVRSFGSALQEMLGNVPEGGLVLTNQTPWACPDTPVGVDPSPTDHQDKEGEREVDPITSTSSPHGQPHACVRAVRVSTRYLPPGRFRILPTTLTRAPEQSALDAVILTDYVGDIVAVWHDDRNECVKRLATLPVESVTAPTYAPVLAEAIFGLLLRLPTPQHKVVAYLGIMVDLCRLKTIGFARAMSACMRELFKMMGTLDPRLRSRLAEYLAYHLASYEFLWPWDRWGHVASAQPHDGQRRFVVEVLDRILRVSYHGKLVETVPAVLEMLRPEEPLAVAARTEFPGGGGDGGGGGGGGASVNGDTQMMMIMSSLADAVDHFAGLARGRATVDQFTAAFTDLVPRLPSTLPPCASIHSPSSSTSTPSTTITTTHDPSFMPTTMEQGQQIWLVEAATRALLEVGAKSLTHSLVVLERYVAALEPVVQSLGRLGEGAVICSVRATWRRNPQRFAMLIDRLMSLRLVSCEGVMSWCAGHVDAISLNDARRHASCWEVLHLATARLVARVEDAASDVREAREEIVRAEAFVREATESLEAARRREEESKTKGEEADDIDKDMDQDGDGDGGGGGNDMDQDDDPAKRGPRPPPMEPDELETVPVCEGRLLAAEKRLKARHAAHQEEMEKQAEAKLAAEQALVALVHQVAGRYGSLLATAVSEGGVLTLPTGTAQLPRAVRVGIEVEDPVLSAAEVRGHEAMQCLLRLRDLVRMYARPLATHVEAMMGAWRVGGDDASREMVMGIYYGS